MIIFDLQCSNGHKFEGWFDDINTFENQKKNDLIECPICTDKKVLKIPSTFGIKTKGCESVLPKLSDEQKNLLNLGKKIIEYVDKNFEDVGVNFAKEALKIHYGVEEPRNIKGSSTADEEQLLKKEGVEFIKIPLINNTES